MAKSVFKKDLYSGLFSIGKVSLYNNKLAINGNECDLVYQEANKLLKEFIERQFINDKHNEASFFLFSDYLTYIPYGESGYKYLNSRLLTKDISLEENGYILIKLYLSEV